MESSDVPLRYGKPNRAQAEQLVNMAGQAFAFDPAQWLGSLDDDGFDNMRTLSDEQGVAAGLVIQAVGQWFGGRRLASHAITALVAAAHARRQKVGRTLTSHALRETRSAQVPLSVLFASTPAFYPTRAPAKHADCPRGDRNQHTRRASCARSDFAPQVDRGVGRVSGRSAGTPT